MAATSLYLMDCLNIVTGNFDRRGGWMFGQGAVEWSDLAEPDGQRRLGTVPHASRRAEGRHAADAVGVCRKRSSPRATARCGRCSCPPATLSSRLPTATPSTGD